VVSAIKLAGPYATLTDSGGTRIVGGRLEIGEQDHMLIRDVTWSLIREAFTEAEKVELRQAVTGEAICPKGVMVAPDLLDRALLLKLMIAVDVAAKS
jgi:hypothetical protein